MMQAGKLRHRVVLQEKRETRDPETGGFEEGWVDVAKVWAEVRALSARDFVEARTDQSQITARITIRYRPDITSLMRVVHRVRGRDHVYEIAGLLPDAGAGVEYLTLPVSEVVGRG